VCWGLLVSIGGLLVSFIVYWTDTARSPQTGVRMHQGQNDKGLFLALAVLNGKDLYFAFTILTMCPSCMHGIPVVEDLGEVGACNVKKLFHRHIPPGRSACRPPYRPFTRQGCARHVAHGQSGSLRKGAADDASGLTGRRC